MRRLHVLGICGLVALAGCGGDDDEGAARRSSSAAAPSEGEGDDGSRSSSSEDSGEGEGDGGAVVTDPADLARRLREAGLGCDDYAEEEPLEGPGYPERKGACTLADGRSIAIDVLADEARWNEYAAAGEDSCEWADGQEFLYAAGRWWSIAAAAESDSSGNLVVHNDTTREVANALDARLESLTC